MFQSGLAARSSPDGAPKPGRDLACRAMHGAEEACAPDSTKS